MMGVNIAPNEKLNELLVSLGTSALKSGIKLADLVRRPQVAYKDIAEFDKTGVELPDDVLEQVEITLKYEGYIRRQKSQVEQFKKLESKRLPDDIDYTQIEVLRLEARQKLNAMRPTNVGQASRISGVSPADVTALLVWLEQRKGGDYGR